MIADKDLPIGVFDSGAGGVSVLSEMIRRLPFEKFIYYGDSAHAPYGTKEPAEVKKLAIDAADFLYRKKIKAMVVACNTATSVAIDDIRRAFPIPVVGMEPAVKPAVELGKHGKILVMATPITLQMEKFHHLVERFHDREEIIPLPCPGLVELIEEGELEGARIRHYLDNLFAAVDMDQVYAVVLGCTHYPFIRKAIAQKLGNGIEIIDGNSGTVRQLERVLQANGLAAEYNPGEVWPYPLVRFFSSGPPKNISMYRKLLEINLAA